MADVPPPPPAAAPRRRDRHARARRATGARRPARPADARGDSSDGGPAPAVVERRARARRLRPRARVRRSAQRARDRTSRPTTSPTGGSATSRSRSPGRSPTSATPCCSTARARASRRSIGRSDDDEIDTAIALPAPDGDRRDPARPARRRSRRPTPKPREGRVHAEKKLRLWVAGDSLVITPGYAIVRAAGREPGDRVRRRRRRPRRDRPHAARRLQLVRRDPTQVKELRPHVVVLGFGGNDDKAYMTGLPEGVSIGASAARRGGASTRRRVGGVMDTVNRAGGFVVWIGLPHHAQRRSRRSASTSSTRSSRRRRGSARAARPSSTPTRCSRATTAASREYLADGAGRLVKVRAGDGVHFERAGGDMIAREVLKELNQRVRPHELAQEAHGVTNRGAARLRAAADDERDRRPASDAPPGAGRLPQHPTPGNGRGRRRAGRTRPAAGGEDRATGGRLGPSLHVGHRARGRLRRRPDGDRQARPRCSRGRCRAARRSRP